MLSLTSHGLYCKEGDFFIDPTLPVPKAVITHGHGDHARIGSGHYITTPGSVPILQHRLGETISISGHPFGETITLGKTKVSFHPAGHIPGSAQVRIDNGNSVWVVSGDYKTTKDKITEPFEIIPCDVFISEATFGLPIFHWDSEKELASELNEWWKRNGEEARISVVFCYSLGKAQRILSLLDPSLGEIYGYGSVTQHSDILRATGYSIPPCKPLPREQLEELPRNSLILAPPNTKESTWLKQLKMHSTSYASGWMRVLGLQRRQKVEKGFVISDHADWNGLLYAIEGTGAKKVYLTHGYTAVLASYLREQGFDADEQKNLPYESL